VQRPHPRERIWVCSPHPGQVFQKDAGRVHVAQRGSVRVPPRTGRTLPQLVQRARRCWQAEHHGLPEILEILQEAERPQIEQIVQVIVL